jgi:tetratricopeptide (TPR) repeat protein
MAPERFRAKCDARSDVYALGLTLYEMLALRPAFEQSDRQELMRQVVEQESPRLRKLNRAVPRDLETVVHRAIEKDPAGRYPTAAALAEELERYLDGRPIRARTTSAVERCWKWAKRRPTVAALLAGFIIAVLSGLAAVTWQWRAELAARNDALVARNDALAARDQARQNFDLARKAVDEYLTRVAQNPLLEEHGLHDLRQDLLEAALVYYRDFLSKQGGDPSLRADAAVAHERVGDILVELGHVTDALAAYDQALALIEPLVRERPGDPQTATARVRLQAGRLQALRNVADRHGEAIVIFGRVKGIGEELLASGGGTEDLPEILARAYDNAAFVFRSTHRLDAAVTVSLAAHELAERATRDRPDNLSVARTRLVVSAQTAYVLRLKGLSDDARRVCEEAIAFGKVQVREHRRDVQMRMHLSRLEANLSLIEKHVGRRVEALRIMRSAADMAGALARENPALVRARFNWAGFLGELSSLQTDVGQYVEATQTARASIELFEALVREVPSSSEYRYFLGCGYGTAGKVQVKAGYYGEGLAMLRKGIAALETFDDAYSLYNLACFFALASTVADPVEGTGATERQRLDADRAMATIRRAIAMGWAESNVLKNEPDFDSLRTREDFPALLLDMAFPGKPFAP